MNIRDPHKIKPPYDPNLKEKARYLRNNPTSAEKLFWNTLRKSSFYQKRTFNRQKPIGPYIVDFFCHQQNLVIEIDGNTHTAKANDPKDANRTQFLESLGYKVIRFTNSEVLNNIEGVMLTLKHKLKTS